MTSLYFSYFVFCMLCSLAGACSSCSYVSILVQMGPIFFNKTLIEPRQANLCLRAFRHDKFQLRMPSHSEGPGIWLSV